MAEFNNLVSSITVLGGVFGMLFSVVCWNIRRSRCVEVSFLGLRCKRNLMSTSELELDVNPTASPPLQHTVLER